MVARLALLYDLANDLLKRAGSLTDNNSAWGDIVCHCGVCSDGRVIANGDVSDQGCASAYGHAVANSWVALDRLEGFSTESYTVKQVNVVANYCGFANHYAHAVVDE